MATSGYNDGISRSISSRPPSHYIVKIESFSLLTKNEKTFTSREFEAEGYKWILILHLNGNKDKNIDDYISLYLKMVVKKDTIRCFNSLKHEWGIDRLIPLEVFKNPSNGYLVNDTCAFGAEVYVCPTKVTRKVDCVIMVKNPISYTHTWKIPNFFKLDEVAESTTFSAGDKKWKIVMYPKGQGEGAGAHISMYLSLAYTSSLPPDSQIWAEFTLRMLDQESSKDQSAELSGKQWFSRSSPAWGYHQFISNTVVNSPDRGYIKKNVCIVEAEVTVHGVLSKTL